MDENTDPGGELAPEVGVPDLVALCRLLNEAYFWILDSEFCILSPAHENS